jgi:hypothetical protein
MTAMMSEDEEFVISGSEKGYVCIWNRKSIRKPDTQ